LAAGSDQACGFELRLVRLAGAGGFVFEQAAIDPLLEQVDLFVSELVALRRHLGLGGLHHHGDQFRPGVAGFGDLAAGAALHRGGESREVEAALGLVRVVAVQAGLFEERQDVVVKGDLVLGGKERRGEQGDDGDTDQRK
jgi:hypothetical protein